MAASPSDVLMVLVSSFSVPRFGGLCSAERRLMRDVSRWITCPGHESVADAVTVVAIHLGAPRNPTLWAVESVRAVAGKGLVGDRHFEPTGAPPGGALTLVEEESVDQVALPPGGTRRQLTVRGVRLNGLIGKRFRIGEVECYGVKLCEPCRHETRDHQGSCPSRRDQRRHPDRRNDFSGRRDHRADSFLISR
jgi:hypothetical protein